MAASYLILAIVLAVTLNHANRLVRMTGTLIGAVGLLMIVSSIVLADFDGTFSAMQPQAHGVDQQNPLILNIQALLASGASVFLMWAAWRQIKRPSVEPASFFNTKSAFGLVSRYAHWIIAALILCLIPMGMFIVVLRDDAPDRSSFVEAHQSLGLAVFLFVLFRLSWLLVNPPPPPSSSLRPWEHRLAVLIHFSLYGFILAFPLTGFFMTAYKGEAINFFGLTFPAFVTATTQPAQGWADLHNIVLPFAFYAIIFAHIAAVLKHQFLDRRSSDVRRMLT